MIYLNKLAVSWQGFSSSSFWQYLVIHIKRSTWNSFVKIQYSTTAYKAILKIQATIFKYLTIFRKPRLHFFWGKRCVTHCGCPTMIFECMGHILTSFALNSLYAQYYCDVLFVTNVWFMKRVSIGAISLTNAEDGALLHVPVPLSCMILFTVDANFIDEVKIGRQFPGLMAHWHKKAWLIYFMSKMWCSEACILVKFRVYSIIDSWSNVLFDTNYIYEIQNFFCKF